MVNHFVIIEFYTYTVQGAIIALPNGLLTYKMLTKRSLRKSYSIILWQVFVNAFLGVTQLIAGVIRLTILYSTNQQEYRSRSFCILMPWNLMSSWGEPMVAICLLMVSIDRLIALIAPITYFKHSSQLQSVQLIAWNLFLLSITLPNWYFSLVETNVFISNFCW
ncbi:unnamed protein product [Anisakis simplex]|uniref:G_PROTEIN_RECEP_F1_2 domain-containing protein n=1 Tax=Anisakis simplex TaxID=6269 RepID=A0A0M3J5P1_ANISI|nr:unnamed protein product [Anisakis simplex]